MRGFWALATCTATAPAGAPTGRADAGGTCGAGFECCSGFCENGQCVDVSQVACAGAGGSCTQTSDCCNAGPVSCVAGMCQALPPK